MNRGSIVSEHLYWGVEKEGGYVYVRNDETHMGYCMEGMGVHRVKRPLLGSCSTVARRRTRPDP